MIWSLSLGEVDGTLRHIHHPVEPSRMDIVPTRRPKTKTTAEPGILLVSLGCRIEVAPIYYHKFKLLINLSDNRMSIPKEIKESGLERAVSYLKHITGPLTLSGNLKPTFINLHIEMVTDVWPQFPTMPGLIKSMVRNQIVFSLIGNHELYTFEDGTLFVGNEYGWGRQTQYYAYVDQPTITFSTNDKYTTFKTLVVQAFNLGAQAVAGGWFGEQVDTGFQPLLDIAKSKSKREKVQPLVFRSWH